MLRSRASMSSSLSGSVWAASRLAASRLRWVLWSAAAVRACTHQHRHSRCLTISAYSCSLWSALLERTVALRWSRENSLRLNTSGVGALCSPGTLADQTPSRHDAHTLAFECLRLLRFGSFRGAWRDGRATPREQTEAARFVVGFVAFRTKTHPASKNHHLIVSHNR